MNEEQQTKGKPRFVGVIKTKQAGKGSKSDRYYINVPVEWSNHFRKDDSVIVELLFSNEFQTRPRPKPEVVNEKPKQIEVTPQISLSIPVQPQLEVKPQPTQSEKVDFTSSNFDIRKWFLGEKQ